MTIDKTMQAKMLAAAALRMQKQQLALCYDSSDLNSRPTAKQSEILNDIGKIQVRFLIAGNQTGKSTLGAREIAWILNNTHPTWKMPEAWKNTPLLIIIAGENRQNIEEEIWKRKLKPLLLDGDDWKEKRNGGQITSVYNEKLGHTILFLVHGQGSEATRAHLQGYRAHYVLLDEMPKDFGTFTELQARIIQNDGYMLVTFTPLLQNLEMRNAVENAQAPYAKKYTWTVWDNPRNLTPERRRIIEQQTAGWSETEKKTRLYGEWSAVDSTVFHFDINRMVRNLPDYYNKITWRHVESVDPATSGTTGLTIWAQDPHTSVWWCVLAKYISGDQTRAPSKTVEEVQKYVNSYSISRRISDTMVWYIAAAREKGLTYLQPWNKTQRKDSLIKNLQEALTCGKIIVSSECSLLVDEFLTMRWSDSSEGKIVASQHYHLVDTCQYFWDVKPKDEQQIEVKSYYQHIQHEWEKTKEARAKQEKQRLSKHRAFTRRRSQR